MALGKGLIALIKKGCKKVKFLVRRVVNIICVERWDKILCLIFLTSIFAYGISSIIAAVVSALSFPVIFLLCIGLSDIRTLIEERGK
jgi:hypothetical protein